MSLGVKECLNISALFTVFFMYHHTLYEHEDDTESCISLSAHTPLLSLGANFSFHRWRKKKKLYSVCLLVFSHKQCNHQTCWVVIWQALLLTQQTWWNHCSHLLIHAAFYHHTQAAMTSADVYITNTLWFSLLNPRTHTFLVTCGQQKLCCQIVMEPLWSSYGATFVHHSFLDTWKCLL